MDRNNTLILGASIVLAAIILVGAVTYAYSRLISGNFGAPSPSPTFFPGITATPTQDVGTPDITPSPAATATVTASPAF